MAAPQTHHEPAGNGFGLVHRVAQSPLGDLWLGLDQRRGTPEPVLLRYVSLSGGATRDTLERVASAGRAAMSLRSELLLPVVDVLQQGPLAVAYAYVEAQPVSVLQSCARARELLFPVSISLRLTIDLLRAVQTVHESWPGWPTEAPFGGLLPASVLVARDGRTRLCDALVASSALLQRGFDLSASELAYRAPEQVYASTAPEPATDVFIAAILLWELVSGRRMLSGRKETIERKLLEHDLPRATADLRSDVRLSRGLLELMNSGLSLDPNQRPHSPGSFATALERCGHDVASQAEVAAFVQELVGPQLDRAALILRLALGYAAGADDAQLAAAAQADPASAQPELAVAPSDPAAAPPGIGRAPSERAVRSSDAPSSDVPSSDEVTVVRESALPRFADPPSAPSAPRPTVPPGVASRELAAAVARALERHRASQPPPMPRDAAPGAPRGTSLGIGAAPQPLARGPALARPLVTGSAANAGQPPVQAQPVLPLTGTVPPMPLLRRRGPADGGSAPEPLADAPPASSLPASSPPASSQNEPTPLRGAVREHAGGVRSYSPPATVRLAPKRALLAAMASVVLLIQLWMFGLARSHLGQSGEERRRLVLPEGPGMSEQSPGVAPGEPGIGSDEGPGAAEAADDAPQAAPER